MRFSLQSADEVAFWSALVKKEHLFFVFFPVKDNFAIEHSLVMDDSKVTAFQFSDGRGEGIDKKKKVFYWLY